MTRAPDDEGEVAKSSSFVECARCSLTRWPSLTVQVDATVELRSIRNEIVGVRQVRLLYKRMQSFRDDGEVAVR